MKSNTKREVVPEHEQYEVDPNVVQCIPGLTRDLAMRTLVIMRQNQFQHALAVGQAAEIERAERGLLYGGMVRCATCGGGMRVKHNPYFWLLLLRPFGHEV